MQPSRNGVVFRYILPDEGVKVLALYSGQEAQMKKLAGHVLLIAATPGHLLDQMRGGKVRLSTFSTIILDEGDQVRGKTAERSLSSLHAPERNNQPRKSLCEYKQKDRPILQTNICRRVILFATQCT